MQKRWNSKNLTLNICVTWSGPWILAKVFSCFKGLNITMWKTTILERKIKQLMNCICETIFCYILELLQSTNQLEQWVTFPTFKIILGSFYFSLKSSFGLQIHKQAYLEATAVCYSIKITNKRLSVNFSTCAGTCQSRHWPNLVGAKRLFLGGDPQAHREKRFLMPDFFSPIKISSSVWNYLYGSNWWSQVFKN